MTVEPANLPEGCYNAAIDLLNRNLARGRGAERKSFKSIKSYKRRKRWL